MNSLRPPDCTRYRQSILEVLEAALPDMQRRAVELDRDAGFPERDLGLLRELRALSAPMPASLGGAGMGTEPDGAISIMDTLRLLGRGNLSVGRLYEAHVNALRLIVRYGTGAQAMQAAADAREGHLFGLWVTDAPDTPVRLSDDGQLSGSKMPCSGAGHATRALITATLRSGGTRMIVVDLRPGARADLAGWNPHGMRATASGRITLDGIRVSSDALVGDDGDYLRQPDFSAGAWRASAVALGGLEALVGELRRQLVERGRQADPHQLARVGEALIAQETARLWVWRAAMVGEADDGDPDDTANTVNLARLAVESACLATIPLVQRALGMGAFRRGTLLELLFRDLAMYLRQPAPDETLTAAAHHFLQRDLPALPA